MSAETNPGSPEHQQLYEALRKEQRMVRIIVAAREACARQGLPRHESAYDRFMWDVVGHPQLWLKQGNYPEIGRDTPDGHIVYDRPIKSSYTEKGHLLHIRETRADVHPNLRYFVASANVRTGSYMEWSVAGREMTNDTSQYSPRYADTLLLSDRPMFSMPSAERPFSGNLLEDSLLEDEGRDRLASVLANRPRSISTNQGGWFVPEQGAEPEVLSPVNELDYALQRFYKQFGQLVLALDYQLPQEQETLAQPHLVAV